MAVWGGVPPAAGPFATPLCASTPCPTRPAPGARGHAAHCARFATIRATAMARCAARGDGAADDPLPQGPALPTIDPLEEAAGMDIPGKARIVIIGGGIVGCSIAYHLARRGVRDVVLLERLQLTHGATWHAAGLVGQLRSSSNLTRLMRYGAELYGRLEAETGQATGWQRSGSLRLASSPARWQELKRSATMAKGFGFHVELVSPRQARDLFPLIELDRRRRRRVDRGRRLRRSDEPDQCVRGRRAGGWPRPRAGRARDGARQARAARDDGDDRPRRHRGRVRDQRRRHVGPRDRGDGGHARSGLRGRAPVLRHRQDGAHSGRPAVAARSRRQFLREAGTGSARGRRLGAEHEAVGRGRHRDGFRTRAAAARLRAVRADRRSRVGAHSGARTRSASGR